MLRVTALVTVAALALHELRYVIGYGGGSHEALSSQGHAYLPFAGALAGALLAVAGAQLTARLLRARVDERPPRFGGAWLWASIALVAIYAGQESIEGLVSAGHPDGLAALTAHGGLVALPLAVVLGGLVAAGLRTAGNAVAAAVRRARRQLPRPRVRARRPRLQPVHVSAGVLALCRAGRAPPAAC
jgi:hypothetical protein